MSRTLFWYVFKDLLRIFLLTSGALAGIMSFGGLLRPFTEHGLDVGQVLSMLGYLTPAMSTYSLPVAALFATTVVYGRLSADNEITACRAAGISHLSMALPAIVLGLGVACLSLLLLCFIVPIFTLKAERVIFSNVARMIANRIDQTHQLKVNRGEDQVAIYAQAAQILLPPADRPGDQIVALVSPMFVTYEPGGRDRLRVPRDFHMARQATIAIQQDQRSDDIWLSVTLEDGYTFPRSFAGAGRFQGGVASHQIAGIRYDSPIRENTKFMDIRRLQHLLANPSDSIVVQRELRSFIFAEQENQYLETLRRQLEAHGRVTFDTGSERFVLSVDDATSLEIRRSALQLTAGGASRTVRLVRTSRSGSELQVDAEAARIRATPDMNAERMNLDIELRNAMVLAARDDEPVGRASFPAAVPVPMPQEIRALENRTADDYLRDRTVLPKRQQSLLRSQLRISNNVQSELHGRGAFAVSCLFLVLAGCALGMMFRSGNFLSAFALSVIPALVCIALIVAGQHTAENIPRTIDENFKNPLTLGIYLIWSGNAAIAAIAVTLLWRLQKQ
jgi:lipopolysaccharide export LptBFGC system permease protein LptF